MIPTHCLLCQSKLIKVSAHYDCKSCVRKLLYNTTVCMPAFTIYCKNSRSDEITEYSITIDGNHLNSSVRLNATILNDKRVLNKYIEYKHDLQYMTNLINRILLLC